MDCLLYPGLYPLRCPRIACSKRRALDAQPEWLGSPRQRKRALDHQDPIAIHASDLARRPALVSTRLCKIVIGPVDLIDDVRLSFVGRGRKSEVRVATG